MTPDFRALAENFLLEHLLLVPKSTHVYLSCKDKLTKIFTEVYEQRPKISEEEIYGAIARAWCHDKNSHKVMDTDLAFAAGEEIIKLLANTKIKENE